MELIYLLPEGTHLRRVDTKENVYWAQVEQLQHPPSLFIKREGTVEEQGVFAPYLPTNIPKEANAVVLSRTYYCSEQVECYPGQYCKLLNEPAQETHSEANN